MIRKNTRYKELYVYLRRSIHMPKSINNTIGTHASPTYSCKFTIKWLNGSYTKLISNGKPMKAAINPMKNKGILYLRGMVFGFTVYTEDEGYGNSNNYNLHDFSR